MEKTPKAYSNEISKLRLAAARAKYPKDCIPLEMEIHRLSTEAAFEAAHLVIFGLETTKDEQLIIDWARAAHGMDVM